MKFHHVGIATLSIEETLTYIREVFDIKDISEVVYDEKQDASLCLVTLTDGVNIELVSGNQVATYCKKRINLYHTCWEVGDINLSIEKHVKSGATLISPPKEAILFDNRKVAFLHTEIGIVELLEA